MRSLVCFPAFTFSVTSCKPSTQDLPPLPPTSERPEYRVLYKTRTIDMLNDDILLGIFNYYRLANEDTWNVRLGWCKLSHVCQRWRYLIFESAFHLGMHITCTNGTPIVDTLDHLPPLPLFVNYQDKEVPRREAPMLSREDELGMYHALQLRDRVRRIDLRLLPSTLNKSLLRMDKPFPVLEHLSLSFINDVMTYLTLPSAFLAPNMRHMALLGIRLPKRLQFLSSTLSLVTLKLTEIQASGYFHPRLLVARLEFLPQLEELSIGFSIPIPRPSTERLLLGKQGNPVTLFNLKSLSFRGVSAYLEHLISQIRAPVLKELNITLFNQLAFTLTHLSHFVNITENIKFPRTATIDFLPGASIILSHRGMRSLSADSDQGFTMHVLCKSSNWQIDCTAQICSALMSALSGIENLTLVNRPSNSSPIESDLETDEINHADEIEGTTWHELLRSFVRVKELRIDHDFFSELSRALEVGEIGLDPGLLPDLQKVVSNYHGLHADSLLGPFIHARQAAGSPVSLHLRGSRVEVTGMYSHTDSMIPR